VVGRLASIVALRLRSKHKTSYTPHVDNGDNVITSAPPNGADGRKRERRSITTTLASSGHQERTAKAIMEGVSERVVEKAVERMLPRATRPYSTETCAYRGRNTPMSAEARKADVASMSART
jgi:large subunit ribosomal protein L13